MLPTERQQKILDLLQERGTISIQELGGLFDVSDMTIHRDLEILEARGVLRRFGGDAQRFRDTMTELQRRLYAEAA